ncbi:MAG: hypothetical protein GHHEDOFH_02529 [Pseudorhodoplanes sp.]|nr:hypothetical protein [Pseudorhodoplanes sp.]
MHVNKNCAPPSLTKVNEFSREFYLLFFVFFRRREMEKLSCEIA